MSAMASAVAAGLLAEIDPLAYPDRMRLLAERARALSDSGGLAAIADELYRSTRFHREIAVFMAVVAGHQPTIAVALSDPDGQIHRAAVSAWICSGAATSAELAAFVADASWHSRRHVYRALRRSPRPGVADELIEAVRDRYGDGEAARLLVVCSAGTLTRLLPELGYAAGNWSALGQRHPEIVLEMAERQLAGLAAADRLRWWGEFGAGVLAAGPAVPLRVLDLLERYGPSSGLPGALHRYTCLAVADPERLMGLLTAPSRARWLARETLPASLLRCLARLEISALTPMTRRLRERDEALAALLEKLPPSRRAAVYDAAYADVDRGQAWPSDQILELLPRTRRRAEAQRVLRLGPICADAALTLHYTAFLPWEQAAAPLTDATRRARAEDRAEAYDLMLTCASRTADADVVAEAISYLRRIRNEQDPVRARALIALTRVSPRLFQARVVEDLDQIAGDALAARDTSGQTRQALARLATTVLGQHVGSAPLMAWSLRTLELIFGNRLPVMDRIDTQLRRGQEAEVFAAVADWLEAGMRRGSYDAVFAIAQALGRRAWRVPQLQDMLRRAIGPGNISGVVRRGVGLWLADPATRSQRVEQVLLSDSSTVTLPEVWGALGHRRTDLLDLVLTGAPPQGKFLADGVRWVSLQAPAVRRWLPRQQAAYAALLADVAGDAGAKVYTRCAAIAAAAQIPDAGWDVVQPYVGSAHTSLAEAALGALARTDRPGEALPILLHHIGDDRARVAVYAAGRAARYLPPRQLQQIFTPDLLTGGKVTSRKETLRLVAILSVPGAGDVLHRAWAHEGQHRDIRAAIVSAARQRLHDPQSWPILEEAATGSPQEALAVVALADPLACAPRYRDRYGQLIGRACRSSDEQLSPAAWLAAPRWAHWIPDLSAIAAARLTDLDDRRIWKDVAAALGTLLDTGLSGSLLRDVTGQLAALDIAAIDVAGDGSDDADDAERDRAARQRLDLLVDRAAQWGSRAGPDLSRAPLIEAGRGLSRQPDLTLDAGTLLLAGLQLHRADGQQLGDGQQLADGLTEISDLVADQPVAASRIADMLVQRVARDRAADPDTIRATVALLERDGRLSAGLFAVALAGYGRYLGWPGAWRTQIRRLRAHPMPDVRTAALAVVMASE
jgi:hypothetical protein